MFPEGFIEEMRALLGAELDDFLAALEGEPALALRINPLRPGACAAAAEFCGDPVPWAENGFYLRPGMRPGASLAHACGAFYLQEASAMLSAAALGLAARETAAEDTAAAPQDTGPAASPAPSVASAPAFGWLKWLLIPLGLLALFVLWFVLTCVYRARKARRSRLRHAAGSRRKRRFIA